MLVLGAIIINMPAHTPPTPHKPPRAPRNHPLPDDLARDLAAEFNRVEAEVVRTPPAALHRHTPVSRVVPGHRPSCAMNLEQVFFRHMTPADPEKQRAVERMVDAYLKMKARMRFERYFGNMDFQGRKPDDDNPPPPPTVGA